MKADAIKLNGCYQMKPEVFAGSVQANGEPFINPTVTVVRIKFPEGRKRAWYFDRVGNAFRSEHFSGPAETIEVEL